MYRFGIDETNVRHGSRPSYRIGDLNGRKRTTRQSTDLRRQCVGVPGKDQSVGKPRIALQAAHQMTRRRNRFEDGMSVDEFEGHNQFPVAARGRSNDSPMRERGLFPAPGAGREASKRAPVPPVTFSAARRVDPPTAASAGTCWCPCTFLEWLRDSNNRYNKLFRGPFWSPAARHTSAEFVAFLADIVVNQPRGKEIHVIVDNLSTHKTNQVAQFIEEHPQVHLHSIPTYSSWLYQVELGSARSSAMSLPVECSHRLRV